MRDITNVFLQLSLSFTIQLAQDCQSWSNKMVILKSNQPDDVEKRRTEPEEKSSSCHQTERTHFDRWAGGGEFRFIEMTTTELRFGAIDFMHIMTTRVSSSSQLSPY